MTKSSIWMSSPRRALLTIVTIVITKLIATMRNSLPIQVCSWRHRQRVQWTTTKAAAISLSCHNRARRVPRWPLTAATAWNSWTARKSWVSARHSMSLTKSLRSAQSAAVSTILPANKPMLVVSRWQSTTRPFLRTTCRPLRCEGRTINTTINRHRSIQEQARWTVCSRCLSKLATVCK